jgi:hypothetical protein
VIATAIGAVIGTVAATETETVIATAVDADTYT